MTTRDTVLHHLASLSAGGVMVLQTGRDVALQPLPITQGSANSKEAGAGAEGGVCIGRARLDPQHGDDRQRERADLECQQREEGEPEPGCGHRDPGSGAIVLQAGQDLMATAATISSEAGGITLAAGRDTHLLAGEANEVIT